MKKPVAAILVCLIVFMIAGCKKAAYEELKLPDESGLMPVSFLSEEAFVNGINKAVKILKTGENESIRTYSDMLKGEAEEELSVSDIEMLSEIGEYYRPKNKLEDSELIGINVKKDYVAFDYKLKNGESAGFQYFRNMSPQTAMNLKDYPFREVSCKGTDYIIIDWPKTSEESSFGYTVHWVKDGVPFTASLPYGYSEKSMLEFCEAEKVTVK